MNLDFIKDWQASPLTKLKVKALLELKPELAGDCGWIYDADGEAGLQALLELEASKATTVSLTGSSKANIYIGCRVSHGSHSENSETNSRRTPRGNKSPEWKVADRSYLYDQWLPLFEKAKRVGERFSFSSIPDGASPISFTNSKSKKLFGNQGLVNGAHLVQTQVTGAIRTSDVLHGQGPEGWLVLPEAVKALALSEGFIKVEIEPEEEPPAACEGDQVTIPPDKDLLGDIEIDISF